MPSLVELQRAFVDAVFGHGDAPAAQWVVAGGMSAAKRLAVYRNNVFHNLREALRDVYPVVERLVGCAFFDHAADRYIGAFPSVSGDLHRFGCDFAGFLAAYPPAEGLPYLPDTARLEWSVHLAFHAADELPLPLARLAAIEPDAYEDLRFRLHPSCHLVASEFPVHRIWEVNQPGYSGDDTVDLAMGGCWLLVRRPHFAIEVVPLTPGEFTLLDRFAAGATLAEATTRACAVEPAFALGEALRQHVQAATLVDVDSRCDRVHAKADDDALVDAEPQLR